jgi:hypothetical protein
LLPSDPSDGVAANSWNSEYGFELIGRISVGPVGTPGGSRWWPNSKRRFAVKQQFGCEQSRKSKIFNVDAFVAVWIAKKITARIGRLATLVMIFLQMHIKNWFKVFKILPSV